MALLLSDRPLFSFSRNYEGARFRFVLLQGTGLPSSQKLDFEWTFGILRDEKTIFIDTSIGGPDRPEVYRC